MPRQLGSQTRVAELRRIFRSDQKQLIDAFIARLCVLYEDLRIELFAISADGIPLLDILDPAEENSEPQNRGKYRRYYFLRRSIGTLYEFAEGLRLLGNRPELAQVLATSDADITALWNEAINFFRSKERIIEQVRNDIGGHFGSKAAIYAVAKLTPEAVGKVELRYDRQRLRVGFRLNFAGDIAATAFVRHLPGATVQEKVENFMQGVLAEGYSHATNSADVLAALHLWPRFGHL
jgi:hypothetical protein